MTLPGVLATVDRQLGDIGCSHVIIRREGRELRFEPAAYVPERYVVCTRGPSDSWHSLGAGGACFTIADVLATDWTIAP